MRDFIDQLVEKLFGKGAVANFAIELASEPIESLLGLAFKGPKMVSGAIKKHKNYREVEAELERLKERLGETFFVSLMRDLEEGNLLKKASGKDAKDLGKLFINSFDFTETELLKLPSVKALVKPDQDGVLLVFKKIERMFIDFYKDALNDNQLALIQMTAYRTNVLVGDRMDSRVNELKDFIKSLFVFSGKGEPYKCCPICGSNEIRSIGGGRCQCVNGDEFPEFKFKLSEEGFKFELALGVKLDDLNQKIDALVTVCGDTNQVVHNINDIVSDSNEVVHRISKKIDAIEERKAEKMRSNKSFSDTQRPYVVNNVDGNRNKIVNSFNSTWGFVSLAAGLLIVGVVLAIVLL